MWSLIASRPSSRGLYWSLCRMYLRVIHLQRRFIVNYLQYTLTEPNSTKPGNLLPKVYLLALTAVCLPQLSPLSNSSIMWRSGWASEGEVSPAILILGCIKSLYSWEWAVKPPNHHTAPRSQLNPRKVKTADSRIFATPTSGRRSFISKLDDKAETCEISRGSEVNELP